MHIAKTSQFIAGNKFYTLYQIKLAKVVSFFTMDHQNPINGCSTVKRYRIIKALAGKNVPTRFAYNEGFINVLGSSLVDGTEIQRMHDSKDES